MNFRGGMGELVRQAGRVQRKVEKRREELKEETFEASAGNDKVTAVANGIPELAEIRIDKALLQEEDLEMVQDLVVAAANAALTVPEVERHCRLDARCRQLMEDAMKGLSLSARAYHRVLRVARTVADLDGTADIGQGHLAEAIQFRLLDDTSY